jgi:hypothetical protein
MKSICEQNSALHASRQLISFSTQNSLTQYLVLLLRVITLFRISTVLLQHDYLEMPPIPRLFFTQGCFALISIVHYI